MTSPNLDPQVRLLAGQLAQLQKRIFQLERNQRASAGPASIAAGGLTVTDPGGVPQVVVGQQSDGSYGVQSVTPQVPVAPDQPLAGPGILGIWVYWDGQMSDGSNPLLDLNSIQVHCSAVQGFTPGPTTLQGVLTGMGLFGVGNLTAGTTYYACLVAVNQAGNTSPASAYTQATAGSVPANIPPGSLSGLQMQTGTLTAAQLAAEAGILGTQIANETLTDDNMQAGTLTARSIASNVVDTNLLVANLVYAGIVNGTLIESAQFIGDGTGDEWLIYNGTPAANNLLLSESSATMADDYGNQVLKGFTVYGTTGGQYYAYNTGPNGIVYYQQPNMSNWLSGPNAGAQMVATAGTGGSPNWILTSGTGFVPESGITLSSVTSFPTLGSGQSLLYGGASSAGTPQVQQNSGLTGTLPIIQTDISSHSAGNSTTAADVTKTWTIPANDGAFASNSGTAYELESCLDIVSGATSSEILTVSIDLDSSLTTLAVLAGGFNSSAASFTYRMPFKLTLILISTSSAHAILQGTVGSDMWAAGTPVNSSQNNTANVTGHQTGLSFAITSSHTIALNVKWAGTGGTGQFAGTNYSILTRKGP